MSREQAREVEHLLRSGPLDLGGDLAEQRPLLEALMTSHPLPAGITEATGTLGGVPVVEVAPATPAATGVLLYLHGGAYALGSARGGAGLAAELAVRTGRRALSVEYRLAPEHPYPAALDDALATYRALLADGTGAEEVVVVGESAGGGLGLALLMAARDQGLPLPAAAVLLSPWADLTLSGASVVERADLDPALTGAALRRRAVDYAGPADPAAPGLSPVRGRFDGLPSLLVQVGSDEILLDDAVRVVAAAAAAEVAVTLEVTPHVPHVFQGFAAVLDEGQRALASAARFVDDQLETAAVATVAEAA
ncbi:alpha/beta hydrolase fold domain-containing protein [Luteimicrobium sp. DT211]|uniref:alpha/beta hydrolase fold domain-containing protein n=1 Tax=Luteimicrobium sp. DT211 TaxID=3393412 RepID=UPI003CE6965F